MIIEERLYSDALEVIALCKTLVDGSFTGSDDGSVDGSE